jgi:hypothetical protein
MGECFNGNFRVSQKIYSKGSGQQLEFEKRHRQQLKSLLAKASTVISKEYYPERYIRKAEGSNSNLFGNDVHGDFPIPPQDEFERQRTAT